MLRGKTPRGTPPHTHANGSPRETLGYVSTRDRITEIRACYIYVRAGLRVIRGTPREYRYFYTEILLTLRINNIGRFLRTVAQFAFFSCCLFLFFFSRRFIRDQAHGSFVRFLPPPCSPAEREKTLDVFQLREDFASSLPSCRY